MRTLKHWKRLLREVVNAPSLETFKAGWSSEQPDVVEDAKTDYKELDQTAFTDPLQPKPFYDFVENIYQNVITWLFPGQSLRAGCLSTLFTQLDSPASVFSCIHLKESHRKSDHSAAAQAVAQYQKTWLFYWLGLLCYQRSHQTSTFVQIIFLLCKCAGRKIKQNVSSPLWTQGVILLRSNTGAAVAKI